MGKIVHLVGLSLSLSLSHVHVSRYTVHTMQNQLSRPLVPEATRSAEFRHFPP
jgi:hypothetical protein